MDDFAKTYKTSEIEDAMRHWSDDLKMMLRYRFGKDKVGHVVIVFPFGSDRKEISWISDADRASVVRLLKFLADHIERPDSKIILPN